MRDPIYRESLVVRIEDNGERELVSFNAGPAGVAQLDLGDGVTVRVDYAEPTRLASIHIQPDARSQAVEDLVGSERATAVLSMAARSDGRPRRMIGDDQADRARSQRGTSERGTYESMLLGQMAKLQSMVDDPWSPDLVRATAALEVAVESAGDLGDRPSIARLGGPAVELAAELLAGTENELSVWAAINPDVASDLRRLCESPTVRHPVTAQAASALATPEFRRDHLTALAAVLPAQVQVLGPTVTLKPSGRLLVQSRDFAADQWVKVVRKNSLVLLALAPMEPTSIGAMAETIVPPDLALSDFEVEVTIDPLPIPESSLSQVMRAVRLGRDAVALHVVGHWQRSQTRWLECSAAWKELGDTSRARVARRYAGGDYQSMRGPTLAERVRHTQRAS